MENRKLHTFRDVYHDFMRNKYREELRGEWAAVVFYRGPAILLTPLFLKYSVRATSVTLVSLVIVFIMPLTLLLSPPFSYACLGLLGVAFNILDCVDGNIARITDSRSRTGQYTDFIADVLQRIVLYITLGLLIQGSVTITGLADLYPFILVVIAALLAVVARLSREYVISGYVHGTRPVSDPDSQSEATKAQTMRKKAELLVFSFISGLDTLTPLLILISGIAGHVSWLPYWLVLYSLLDFTYTQFRVARAIR